MASVGDQALALLLGSALGGGVRQILPEKNKGGSGGSARADALAPNPLDYQNTIDYIQGELGRTESPDNKAKNLVTNLALGSSLGGTNLPGPTTESGVPLDEAPAAVLTEDTHIADLMNTVQKQRVIKAAQVAARLAPVLSSPYKSQAEKKRLTTEYNSTYGDIKIPAARYTKEQQAQLNNLALIRKHQDTAVKMGLPPEIVAGVDANGNPIKNVLVDEAQQQKQQLAFLNRQEEQTKRLEAKDERQQDFNRRMDLIKAFQEQQKNIIPPEKPKEGVNPIQNAADYKEYLKLHQEYLKQQSDVGRNIESLYRTGKLPEQPQASATGFPEVAPGEATIRAAVPTPATMQAAAERAKAEGIRLVMNDAEKQVLQDGESYIDARNGKRYTRKLVADTGDSMGFPQVSQPTIGNRPTLSDILILAPTRK